MKNVRAGKQLLFAMDRRRCPSVVRWSHPNMWSDSSEGKDTERLRKGRKMEVWRGPCLSFAANLQTRTLWLCLMIFYLPGVSWVIFVVLLFAPPKAFWRANVFFLHVLGPAGWCSYRYCPRQLTQDSLNKSHDCSSTRQIILKYLSHFGIVST